MNEEMIPIIAIDGTSSSGKGSVARRLAKELGYHYLNSGALYRLTAYTVLQKGISLSDTEKVIEIARGLSPLFDDHRVIVEGVDVWPIISTQEYGNHASLISPIPEVRQALHECQRNMIRHPGLVAEGRDMCTVVFKDACAKLYLDAELEIRAKRRHKDEEISQSGKSLEQIIDELKERDRRDMTRKESPLYPAEDAFIIDTTNHDLPTVIEKCKFWCKEKGLKV